MKKLILAIFIAGVALQATAKAPEYHAGLGEYTIRMCGMERTFKLFCRADSLPMHRLSSYCTVMEARLTPTALV